MQVQSINNTNFKALDTSMVLHPKSKKLIEVQKSDLSELAKKYEIVLTDSYDVVNNIEFLSAYVDRLGKSLNFFAMVLEL